jgi:DNA-directed RNA polymerase subunit RPC12/RpoP
MQETPHFCTLLEELTQAFGRVLTMKLIETTCRSCGANLTIDQACKQAFCQYCGSRVLIDDEVQRLKLDDAEETGYYFERGRLRAQAEAARDTEPASATPEPTIQQTFPEYPTTTPLNVDAIIEKPRRKTWIWVLGWLFFPPVPLAILIMRAHEEDPPSVTIDYMYVLKAFGWVLGWCYIFPVPLTILMLKKKDMAQPVRIAIIAIAWLLYLPIFFKALS